MRARLPRLTLAAVLALLVAACGIAYPTPTTTPYTILLPPQPSRTPGAPGPGTRPQPAATGTPAVRATATATRVLSAPLPTMPPSPVAAATASAAPAVSAVPAPALSGRLVMQTASGGDIITMNLDGSGQTRMAAGIDPAWSPNGAQIAYTQWTEPQGVYVVGAQGGVPRLVHQIAMAKSPTWSPDGTQIAFTWRYKVETTQPPPGAPPGFATRTRDFWKVSVVDVNTGTRRDLPLDPDGDAFAPSWGPTGRIVFKGVRGLYLADPAGATVRPITDSPFQDTPAWSPDGARIALAARIHNNWDIAVVNADGSGLAALTGPPTVFPGSQAANNVSPAWSPDGRSLLFASDRSGAWRLYVMNADGSGQRTLNDTPFRYDFASERVASWK